MFTYQQEFPHTLRGEVEALVDLEWEEVGDEPDLKPELDWDMIFALEDAGALFVFTCRHSGVLVGYCVVSKYTGIANKKLVIAEGQALFVVKEHRKFGVANNMIKFAMDVMKEEGANRFHLSASNSTKDISPMMSRLGFSPIETKFGRSI